MLTDYVRKHSARSRKRVFVVHRLDRETSGVLIFAKSEEAKVRLQDRWKETKKTYLAAVHGKCDKMSETITSYLAENKAYFVYATSDPAQGKLAETAYRVLKQTRRFALLEVDLVTGRKNQIRVHLAGIGHPVVGDRKYGRRDDGLTPASRCTPGRSPSRTPTAARFFTSRPKCPPIFRNWWVRSTTWGLNSTDDDSGRRPA